MENKNLMLPDELIKSLEADITNIINELENYSLKEYVEILNRDEAILQKVRKHAFYGLIEKISSRCDFDTSEYLIDKYKLDNKKLDEKYCFGVKFYKDIKSSIDYYLECKIDEIKNEYIKYENNISKKLDNCEIETEQLERKMKILETEIGEDKIDDELDDYNNENVTETSPEISKVYQRHADLYCEKIVLNNSIKILSDFESTYYDSYNEFSYHEIGKFEYDNYKAEFDNIYSIINNYSEYLTDKLANDLIKNKNKFIKLDKVFEKIITDINNDENVSLASKRIYLEGIKELAKKIEQEKMRKNKNKKK